MKDCFFYEIKALNNVKIFKNVNIKKETNFKLNTTFLYKIEIYSFLSVKDVFNLLKKYNIKHYILGNASNVLFAQTTYKAALIKIMTRSHKSLNILNAGDNLNIVNNKLINQGISSLDFLAGVPCTIGGAIYMNAGAFGESMGNIIECVYIYDIDKEEYRTLKQAECDFGYRSSYFQKNNVLILGAKIKLKYDNLHTVKQMHIKRLILRKEKLPLEYPNIGSIFKNPPSMYAGELIEKSNLKGVSIGGAKISEKHANVIVNFNDARYEDVFNLIDMIKNKVYMKYKILLEEEIITFK